MTGVVVDASVALAWCFPDEATEYADSVLASLKGRMIMIPALWAVEVANALLVGERRRRLRQSDILEFAELIAQLSLVQDTPAAGKHVGNVLATAREYDLTAYDAAYLELSIREHAELATFDVKLQKAARKAGVSIFAVKSL